MVLDEGACTLGAAGSSSAARRLGDPLEDGVTERPADVVGDPAVQPLDRGDEQVVEQATGKRSVIGVDVDVARLDGRPSAPPARRCRTATSSNAFPRHAAGTSTARAPTGRPLAAPSEGASAQATRRTGRSSGRCQARMETEYRSSAGKYPVSARKSRVCGSGVATTKRTAPLLSSRPVVTGGRTWFTPWTVFRRSRTGSRSTTSPARCSTSSTRASRGSCGRSGRPPRARALWRERSPTGCGSGAPAVETRHGEPFYGLRGDVGTVRHRTSSHFATSACRRGQPRRRGADPRRLCGGDGARLGGDDRRAQHIDVHR